MRNALRGIEAVPCRRFNADGKSAGEITQAAHIHPGGSWGESGANVPLALVEDLGEDEIQRRVDAVAARCAEMLANYASYPQHACCGDMVVTTPYGESSTDWMPRSGWGNFGFGAEIVSDIIPPDSDFLFYLPGPDFYKHGRGES